MGGAEGGQGGEGSGREWRTRGGEAASQSEFERTAPPRRAAIPRDSSVSAALLRVALDEALHVLPRVGGRVLELLVLPVEEAVRRARVHVLLVLDARLLKRLVERFAIRLRNAFVGAAEDRQHGTLVVGRRVDR